MEISQGLTDFQVSEQRNKFGLNLLKTTEGPLWPEILLNQIKNPLIYILLAVGLISLILSEYIDAGLVFFVFIVNIFLGFWQEFSAENTLKALRGLLKPRALVIRSGQRTEIDAKDVVPGDIVLLGSGDKVVADGRIIESSNLLINEAILTGEGEAILKSSKANNCQVYMGSVVLSGRGKMEVEKIGNTTEIGKINLSLSEIRETATPLEVKLAKFIKIITWVIVCVCLITLAVGLFYHENFWEMLKISVVLSIAAIPEALPIALTVILALGMKKILKKHGLVKRLLSIETLGATSVVCTDKTGTLTEGNMRVVKVEGNDQKRVFQAIVLTNERKSNIELAIWEYAKTLNYGDPETYFHSTPRISDEPFDSEKKYSLSVNMVDKEMVTFLNGAPEIVIENCTLTKKEKEKILGKINSWAKEGLRLLGLTYKIGEDEGQKKNFQWLGLVAIEDPLRPEAKRAIEWAKLAGIVTKIVTGDHRLTSEKMARLLGFDLKNENILEGVDLEKMTEKELGEKIDNVSLFCRITPHQKLKIVSVLQEKGEVVAMTGDGVNDAPALKKADIGIAVGSATEVAKEASDLILLDNNFQTIIAVCEEGRLILANIKKVIGYVLSNAFAEIILIFGAIILDMPVPITIVQILWIHLICDGPPDILLSFEPKENDLMQITPKNVQNDNILSNKIKFLILAISSTIGIGSLLLFEYYFINFDNLELGRTMAFATVASASLVYIFAFKNFNKSIFKTENFFKNKPLFLGILYGFLLIIIAIYVPYFNEILQTVPLQFIHWVLIFAVAILATFWVELVKSITRKIKID